MKCLLWERKRQKFFAAAATPNRQAERPHSPLLYNRHDGLKQFVINFRVGEKEKVEIKKNTKKFFFAHSLSFSLALLLLIKCEKLLLLLLLSLLLLLLPLLLAPLKHGP